MDQQTSSSTKSISQNDAPSDALVADVTSQGGNTAILISASKGLQQLHEVPISPEPFGNMNFSPKGFLVDLFWFRAVIIWCRDAAERCFAKEILQCQLRTPIPAEDLGVVTKGFFYLEEKKSWLINLTHLLKIYEI